MEIPEAFDECLYFTNRGHVQAWVYRNDCPSCKKAKMGKPVDPKTGKVKIRATVYVCPGCGFEEDKQRHEASCTLQAVYTCPDCGKQGESTAPYVRKKYKGIPSFVVACQHCGELMPLTKKLKEPKKS